MTTFVRFACVICLSALTGCSGLYLGDNPGPDVAKQTGPLTAPPAHMSISADPR
jgi:hypothetical protein